MIKKALMVTAGLAIGGFLFVKYGKKPSKFKLKNI